MTTLSRGVRDANTMKTTNEREEHPELYPPEPFETWEQWERQCEIDERNEMRKYIRGMWDNGSGE